MNIREVIISDIGRSGSGRRICSKSIADLIYTYCIEPNAGIIPKSAFEKNTQNPERKMKQLVSAVPEICRFSESLTETGDIIIQEDYIKKIRELHSEIMSVSDIIDIKTKDTLKVGLTETEDGILLDDRFEFIRFYHYITNPKNEANFLFNENLEKKNKIGEPNIEKLQIIKVRIVHEIVKFHFMVTKQIVCPKCSTINIMSQSKIETLPSVKCKGCSEQTLNTNKFKPKDVLPYFLYEGIITYEEGGTEDKIDVESFKPITYGTYWLQGYFQLSKHNPLKFITIANKRFSRELPFEWIEETKNVFLNFLKSLRKHTLKANLPLEPNKASLVVFAESLKLFMHALSNGTFTLGHSFYLTGPDVGKTYPIEIVNSLYYNNVPDLTIDASRFTIPGLTGTTYEYKIQDETITLFVPGALSRTFILWEEMMNEQFLNPRTKDNPQELVKSVLLKDAGNVTMKGGESFERNAVISAAGNYFEQHLSEYRTIVNRYYRKKYKENDPELMSSKEFVGIPEEIDIFRPIETYQEPDIKHAIKLARDELTKKGKDWTSGIQLPLIQRFFFYYRLSPEATKIKLGIDFDRFHRMAIDRSRKIDILSSLYIPDLPEQIREKCKKRTEITSGNIKEFEEFAALMKIKYKSLGEITRFEEILYRIIETLFLASNENYLTEEVKEVIEKILCFRERIIEEQEYHCFERK